MARPLVINDSISLKGEELKISFARSSGPGGQHVNKSNTKAVLRWRPAAASQLPDDVRQRFAERYAHRLNQHGELVLSSDQFREQLRNVTACRSRLRQLILSVLEPPRQRRKTRPSRAAVERRLESKRRTAQRKQRRRYRPEAD